MLSAWFWHAPRGKGLKLRRGKLCMANIFRQLEKGDNIFKDERVFQPDYLPEELEHREKEIKEIAYVLKGLSEGKHAEHLIIYGSTGTGKTCTTKFVLKQLTEYTQKVKAICINCWEINTRYAILSAIATEMGEVLPRRGIAADEIMQRMFNAIKYAGISPVIVLDEVDRLFASQYEEQQVLYDLARSRETHGINLGLIAITNNEHILAELDPRVRSSLAQHALAFSKYTPAQLRDILRERAKLGFFPNALDKEVIPVCAAIGAKRNGDARIALHALWAAGKEAEKEGAKKVTLAHVEKAKESIEKLGGLVNLQKFGEIERKILEALAKGPMDSGELYEKVGLEERNARRYLERLEMLGLITTEEIKKGSGRSRKISLKASRSQW